MSLQFIGILWAFNLFFLTLSFLISSSSVLKGILWDSLTYNWMWVIIYSLIRAAFDRFEEDSMCICSGEGKAHTS